MIILALFAEVKAQARLVVNGAQLVLANGAKLVIENPASTALTATTGGIKCTTPNDQLIWHTGATAGIYSVPFLCRNGLPLPVSFTQTGGTGAGYIRLATYATPTWQNSLYLPPNVLHVNNLYGSDNSAQTADRFWQLKATGYTLNPELSNITLAYATADITASGNAITEGKLAPFQWSETDQNWRGSLGTSEVDIAANTVHIPLIEAKNQNSYWMLADNTVAVLPVHFIQFTATANGTRTDLNWATAMVENNEYFGVERAKDGRTFTEIARVNGAGTTQHQSHYATTDESPLQGQSYYRIKQVDYDGKSSYSPIRSVYIGAARDVDNSYPNPATTHQVLQFTNWPNQTVTNRLTDLQGRQLLSTTHKIESPNQALQLNLPVLPAGTYFLTIYGVEKVITQKLLIGN